MQSSRHRDKAAEKSVEFIGIRRLLWSAAGSIFLILGIVGIVVPLLPTTPFLLLALYCYFRGSKIMYFWMLRNRIFGKYLRDYHEKNILPLKVKVGTVSLLWIVIGISALFFTDNLFLRLLLLAVAVGVTIHILLIGRKFRKQI